MSDAASCDSSGDLPKVFKGTHIENEEVTVMRGAEVEISADAHFAVYADGEHLADLPATHPPAAARPAGDRAPAPA